jgi:hypothetical protein
MQKKKRIFDAEKEFLMQKKRIFDAEKRIFDAEKYLMQKNSNFSASNIFLL